MRSILSAAFVSKLPHLVDGVGVSLILLVLASPLIGYNPAMSLVVVPVIVCVSSLIVVRGWTAPARAGRSLTMLPYALQICDVLAAPVAAARKGYVLPRLGHTPSDDVACERLQSMAREFLLGRFALKAPRADDLLARFDDEPSSRRDGLILLVSLLYVLDLNDMHGVLHDLLSF